MIEVSYDRDMLAQVERKLGRMKSDAPKALKNAINQTARQTMADLKKQVRKQYTVKAGKVSKAMSIQRATNSRLDATIFVRGKPLNITNYKTTTPKKGAKAQIVKDGGLKKIVGPKEITAFRGPNGLIWQRQKEGKRYPIAPLKSLAIPKAVGNEWRVYGVVRPSIRENLKRNVENQIRKILEGNNGSSIPAG